MVAPFAGAWIEISWLERKGDYRMVAPFAGAWIEILVTSICLANTWSLPSRERGLKLFWCVEVSPR